MEEQDKLSSIKEEEKNVEDKLRIQFVLPVLIPKIRNKRMLLRMEPIVDGATKGCMCVLVLVVVEGLINDQQISNIA